MLTGDKLETATCIAKSSHLVSRTQAIHTFRPVSDRAEAHLELNAFRRKGDAALVITGESLEVGTRGISVAQRFEHWTFDQAVMGLVPVWGVIKAPRSTQPFIPPG